MRGKVKLLMQNMKIFGITPAYAGKSILTDSTEGCISGSPPPMRGKVGGRAGRDRSTRITPAYAGKRFSIR